HLRCLPRLRRADRGSAAQRHPVDARLHQLQGKAELVNPVSNETPATVGILTEFYTDKLASLLQHQAHARFVEQYDANNTYQYVINREEVQLAWLAKAIMDAGAPVPDSAPAPPAPPDRVKDAAHSL